MCHGIKKKKNLLMNMSYYIIILLIVTHFLPVLKRQLIIISLTYKTAQLLYVTISLSRDKTITIIIIHLCTIDSVLNFMINITSQNYLLLTRKITNNCNCITNNQFNKIKQLLFCTNLDKPLLAIRNPHIFPHLYISQLIIMVLTIHIR